MQSLYSELMEMIIGQLPVESIVALSATCKRNYKMMSEYFGDGKCSSLSRLLNRIFHVDKQIINVVTDQPNFRKEVVQFAIKLYNTGKRVAVVTSATEAREYAREFEKYGLRTTCTEKYERGEYYGDEEVAACNTNNCRITNSDGLNEKRIFICGVRNHYIECVDYAIICNHGCPSSHRRFQADKIIVLCRYAEKAIYHYYEEPERKNAITILSVEEFKRRVNDQYAYLFPSTTYHCSLYLHVKHFRYRRTMMIRPGFYSVSIPYLHNFTNLKEFDCVVIKRQGNYKRVMETVQRIDGDIPIIILK